MVDRVVLGNNGDGYGLWVRPPANSPVQFPHTLASTGDMLKIHAQGAVYSYSDRNSNFGGFTYWRHDVEVPFFELPYIPLAFMCLRNRSSEPFSFPPNLYDLLTVSYFNNWGYVDHMPPIGIMHNKLKFSGWSDQRATYLYYTVFLAKLRDRF